MSPSDHAVGSLDRVSPGRTATANRRTGFPSAQPPRRRLLALAAVSQRDVNGGGFRESSSAHPSSDDDASGRSYGHKRHQTCAPSAHLPYANEPSERGSSIRGERETDSREREQRRARRRDLVVSQPRPAPRRLRHDAARSDAITWPPLNVFTLAVRISRASELSTLRTCHAMSTRLFRVLQMWRDFSLFHGARMLRAHHVETGWRYCRRIGAQCDKGEWMFDIAFARVMHMYIYRVLCCVALLLCVVCISLRLLGRLRHRCSARSLVWQLTARNTVT